MLIAYFYIYTTVQTYGVIDDKNILNNLKKSLLSSKSAY